MSSENRRDQSFRLATNRRSIVAVLFKNARKEKSQHAIGAGLLRVRARLVVFAYPEVRHVIVNESNLRKPFSRQGVSRLGLLISIFVRTVLLVCFQFHNTDLLL